MTGLMYRKKQVPAAASSAVAASARAAISPGHVVGGPLLAAPACATASGCCRCTSCTGLAVLLAAAAGTKSSLLLGWVLMTGLAVTRVGGLAGGRFACGHTVEPACSCLWLLLVRWWGWLVASMWQGM